MPAKSNKSKRVRVGYAAAYLLIVLISQALLALTEHKQVDGTYGPVVRWTYRRLSRSSAQGPEARSVRLVGIQEHVDPVDVMNDPCARREYLGKLVRALVVEQPAEIVYDFTPAPAGTCAAKIDHALRAALLEAAHSVPVVVGWRGDPVGEASTPLPQGLKANVVDGNDLLLQDSGLLGEPETRGRSGYGITTTRVDTRVLPRNWYGFDESAVRRGDYTRVSADSLSMAAYRLYPQQKSLETLQDMERHKDPPLISFVDMAKFRPVRAIDLVCHGQETGDWRTCAANAQPVSDLQASVVVVGMSWNSDSTDYQQSVLGTMPGFVLQANYVEALLDDRLMWQLPELLRLGLALALGLVITVIFFVEQRLLPALGWSLLLILLCAFCCRYITLEWGWYLDFWISALLALPVTALEWIRDTMKEWARQADGIAPVVSADPG